IPGPGRKQHYVGQNEPERKGQIKTALACRGKFVAQQGQDQQQQKNTSIDYPENEGRGFTRIPPKMQFEERVFDLRAAQPPSLRRGKDSRRDKERQPLAREKEQRKQD